MAGILHIGAVGSLALLMASLPAPATDGAATKDVKTIIFAQQKIEGKIRRPQLVLIKADERPQFETMVIQSSGRSNSNITESVPDEVLDRSPYSGAFQFDGTRIKNYVP